MLNRLPKLINGDFFFTLEIQIKKFGDIDFHGFVVFLYDLKVIQLNDFSETLKGN